MLAKSSPPCRLGLCTTHLLGALVMPQGLLVAVAVLGGRSGVDVAAAAAWQTVVAAAIEGPQLLRLRRSARCLQGGMGGEYNYRAAE